MSEEKKPEVTTMPAGAGEFTASLVNAARRHRSHTLEPAPLEPAGVEPAPLEPASAEPAGLDASIFQSVMPVAAAAFAAAPQRMSIPPAVAAGPRMLACMVTHGMGQQVPFETVSQIGEAFVAGRQPRSVQANRVQLSEGADLLSRMELVYDPWTDPVTGAITPETHVHLYEGYWAPLTEGKITYTQALSFLFSAAYAGLRSAVHRTFDRWIFGQMYDLPVKKHTLNILVVIVLVLLAGLGLAYLGGLQIALLWKSLQTQAGLFPSRGLWVVAGSMLHSLFGNRTSLGTLVLVLAALAYRWVLRFFLIEYLGDVAIYVSSYKVSAFEEIRTAIQKRVLNVGTQIFAAAASGSPAEPLYDEVIFIGHSLGSVITYDLVNALMVWDSCSCAGAHNVVGRTSRLITFGSPLDKTAFLFRTQTSAEHHYREALAALQQPMVLDYALRPFPWINLYSHQDIVSGLLQYYDVPQGAPRPAGYNPVQNRVDPAARVPIYAHTQYWGGALLRELLQDAIRYS